MTDKNGVRPPVFCRWLIWLAGRLAPPDARREWRARWDFRLYNLWILVERGELTNVASAEVGRFCRDAFLNAFWLRFSRPALRRWLRGPVFPLVCCAGALAVLAVGTNGFSVCRSLVEMARGLGHSPPPMGVYDAREDRLFFNIAPIGLALASGIALIAIGRLSFNRYGWRYWLFLAVKAFSAMLLVILLWIEGGSALRARIPSPMPRIFVGGIVLALLFVAAFGWTLRWCLADQRRRCPVCLRRLAMPVTVGSWASVFDPATTEMLCDEGHGSLAAPDSEAGAPDRWVALDSSWRGLFDRDHAAR
jgi:hypothetical protein